MDAALPTPQVWKNSTIHWVVLVISIAATLLCFQPVLVFMWHTWGQVEEYSYGYFIAPISAFLVWQRSDRLRQQALEGSFWGLALVGLALALRWVGDASAIRVIAQYGFVIAVVGISVCAIGWRGTRIIAMPLAVLIFMIPLPQFLLREISFSLQLLSSELGVALIRAAGISVFLEGNVIDLGSYKMQVVEACNGLRYLFPLMVLGFLAAYFYRAEMWKRVVLVLSTVPLTILVNSARIGIIGITVEHWGRDMAEGFVHDFEGWFMFLVCLALLLLEMLLLARIRSRGQSLGEVFAIELPPAPEPGARSATHPLSLASLASAALLVVAALMSASADTRIHEQPKRTSFGEFPLQLDGGWSGHPDRLPSDVLATLAADDYLLANYRRPASSWVNFYVAYYKSQSGGESSHSPRTCIPGGGWSITNLKEVEVQAAASGASPQRVNRALIQKADQRHLVYYWFSQRGRSLTNEYAVKWYVLRDSIATNRSDGALIRLVTPIQPDEPEADADRRLAAFMAAVEPRLAAYVPQ